LVIGPLNKKFIKELAERNDLSVPVMTLNYVEGLAKGSIRVIRARFWQKHCYRADICQFKTRHQKIPGSNKCLPRMPWVLVCPTIESLLPFSPARISPLSRSEKTQYYEMTAFAYALAGQIVNSVHARINLDLYLHLEQQKQTNNRAAISACPGCPGYWFAQPLKACCRSPPPG
jgi:hypothetical protein